MRILSEHPKFGGPFQLSQIQPVTGCSCTKPVPFRYRFDERPALLVRLTFEPVFARANPQAGRRWPGVKTPSKGPQESPPSEMFRLQHQHCQAPAQGPAVQRRDGTGESQGRVSGGPNTCFASPVRVTSRHCFPGLIAVIGMLGPMSSADRAEDRFRLIPGRDCRTSPTERDWNLLRICLDIGARG